MPVNIENSDFSCFLTISKFIFIETVSNNLDANYVELKRTEKRNNVILWSNMKKYSNDDVVYEQLKQ